MNKNSWILVGILLIPPWAFLCLLCYWYFFDNSAPMTFTYNHPTFISKPAKSIEEAKLHSITTAKPGSIVWTYREYCITKPNSHGVLHQRWDGPSFSWTIDDGIEFVSKIGCRSSSFAVEVPKIGFSSNIVYNSVRTFRINPIKDLDIVVPGIPLMVDTTKKNN